MSIYHRIITAGILLFLLLFTTTRVVMAQPTATPSLTPTPFGGIPPSSGSPTSDNLGIPLVGCNVIGAGSATGCPEVLATTYYPKRGERCANDNQTGLFSEQLKDFYSDPARVHLWVEDPEITAQGKADERARQFIWWVLNHPAIDDHPTLKSVWSFSRNIALFFTILIATIFGIGIIIAQRQNFDLKIEVSPLILKLVVMLLYITFSASIVLTIIQLSEVLMKFFMESLGGRDLFNIYFTANSAENNYIGFTGCRDLNIRVQEAVKAELFLLRLTNITYYVMGIMLLLRKILLWFLLFVSPFLAILMPFIFIRNTGWIWMGVFFQWVFYGPLFALFLGGLAQIWKKGIPFPFNFARTNTFDGYVYPTAINIAYGGPGQEWTAVRPAYTNNGNYVDTFTEYIISLLMLWAVTFFPWWLLRIFRDYCCEGIYAMKNILMAMYDQMRSGPPPGPGPVPTPIINPTGTTINVSSNIPTTISTRLENIEEIKKAQTQSITQNLNLTVNKLTDIARYETNKQTNSTVNKNIQYLQNPMKAESSQDRQKFMNLRTELFNRSIKEDKIARSILNATSTSRIEQLQSRKEILQSTPQSVPVTHIVSVKVAMPSERVQSITSNVVNTVANNNSVVNNIAAQTQLAQKQVQTILNSYTQNISQPFNNVVNNIATQTNVSKDKVKEVLTQTNNYVKSAQVMSKVAEKVQVDNTNVEKIVESLPATLTEKEPITKVISLKLHVAQDKAGDITTSIFNSVSNNEQVLTNVQNQTGVPVTQIKSIVNTYVQNISKPADVVTEEIHKTTGIETEKVRSVVGVIAQEFITSKEIIKDVAQKENIKEEDVQRVVRAQIPLVTEPEKHVEKTIAVPSTVSLEDYEEVKTMWQEQYESGEVPTTENIQSREQWIDNDVVVITNTLNKLLSPNEEIKQQGLDDVGYLLPIFMINNLSGEELIVYLKAKLEAAKAVKRGMNKKEDVEVDDEEEEVFVEAAKKKEEAKTMTLEDEQEIPEEQPKDDHKTDENKGPGKDSEETKPTNSLENQNTNPTTSTEESKQDAEKADTPVDTTENNRSV